jgi:hypothetical protein
MALQAPPGLTTISLCNHSIDDSILRRLANINATTVPNLTLLDLGEGYGIHQRSDPEKIAFRAALPERIAIRM